jgi:hypothetical protein
MLNDVALYPLLPIDYEDIPIVLADRRMASGQRRRALAPNASKLRVTVRLGELTEAERTAIRAAALFTTTLEMMDEHNVVRVMTLEARRFSLVRTTPDTPGSPTATGPAYYDCELELEEV